MSYLLEQAPPSSTPFSASPESSSKELISVPTPLSKRVESFVNT